MSDEGSQRVIEVLEERKGERLTLLHITDLLKGRPGKCPDDLARELSKLRKGGRIQGEFSEGRSAWVYWI